MTTSSLKPLTPLSSEDHVEHIYDSDFSQASLSSTSSVDSTLPIDPELLSLIPPEMLTAPPLSIDMIWHCPMGGGSCMYCINLCAPTDDNLRLIRAHVPHEAIVYLISKDWKSDDEQVMAIFYEMVNAHWESHLKELDIKYIRQGDAVKSFTVQSVPNALLANSYRVPLNGYIPKDTGRGPQRSGRIGGHARSHQISNLSSRHIHLPGTLHYIKIQYMSYICYTSAHESFSPSLQSPNRHRHRPPPYHPLHYRRDSERCVVGCEDHQNRHGQLPRPVCDQREA
jgi:hypothetical protein